MQLIRPKNITGGVGVMAGIEYGAILGFIFYHQGAGTFIGALIGSVVGNRVGNYAGSKVGHIVFNHQMFPQALPGPRGATKTELKKDRDYMPGHFYSI